MTPIDREAMWALQAIAVNQAAAEVAMCLPPSIFPAGAAQEIARYLLLGAGEVGDTPEAHEYVIWLEIAQQDAPWPDERAIGAVRRLAERCEPSDVETAGRALWTIAHALVDILISEKRSDGRLVAAAGR
ncbi:MAG: hypothetical protein ACF8R7_16635 [Phycisphaerales bacterium JB039]